MTAGQTAAPGHADRVAFDVVLHLGLFLRARLAPAKGHEAAGGPAPATCRTVFLLAILLSLLFLGRTRLFLAAVLIPIPVGPTLL
jgi:hypothetical protein